MIRMTSKLIALLLITSFYNSSFAEPPAEPPLGWGYEFGFGSANDGSGLRFLLESRTLMVKPHATEKRKDSYSVLFGMESLNVSDETVPMASVGLRIRRIVEGYANNSYLDINALYTLNNEDIVFEETGQWGSRIAFGFDLPYAQYARTRKPDEFLYGYFFVEGGWLVGFPKADRIAGRPDLLNGLIATIGFKARWK
ncbi:MAG: hypothetical protein HRT45_04195 [Bdellovibrionales bacterium]|nr:hypothetical protein [Bdellovibrionales bacterium]